MTRQARRTLAAGFASATALAALFPLFQGTAWFWRVFGAVLAVTAAGLIARSVRLPALLQPLLAALALAAYLVVVFAHQTLDNGLPSAATVDLLQRLVEQGQKDIDTFGPPVPTTPGLLLLTAAGVGAVAIAVDLLAVVLDRVAVAGLPLLVLFAVPSAVLPGGLGGTAFVIGAAGWLVLLLEEGSERVSRWGTPMRAGPRAVGEDSSLGRVGRRIGAAALGLAVVVPALVPGLDHRLVSGSGGDGPGGEGPSSATTYNPLTTLQSQLTLPSPRQLFVYTTNDPQPDYVRMTTLDLYAGGGWASSKLEADRDEARVQKGIRQAGGEDDGTPRQTFRMRVAVDTDHLAVHWLPLPYGPRQVDVDGTWLWDAISQTAFSASRTTTNLPPYTVRAERVLPTRDGLLATAGQPVPTEIQARYDQRLQVPRQVVTLTRRVTRAARTPYDRAVAIQRWFTDPRNGFVYDVAPTQARGGEDPLLAFLAGKHGFCEQYATAMAVLLRVAGLPSRVAVGFTPGDKVRGHRDTYSVTTSQAHAWPEAWFPGWGWVRFEPTPAANGATIPDYTLAPAPGGVGQQPATPTPSPRPAAASQPHDPEDLLREITPTTSTAKGSSSWPRWALLGGLLVLVLVSPWAATQLRRRARARRMEPLVAWEQLRDDVADVGGPWRATDSPGAAARRLEGLVQGPARAAVGRLATAAEVVRYAPPGRASSLGLANGLHADLELVRRTLQASAPRGVRWRARLVPPSTLRWATHVVAERVADGLDLSDRALAVVFRPARRLLRVRV